MGRSRGVSLVRASRRPAKPSGPSEPNGYIPPQPAYGPPHGRIKPDGNDEQRRASPYDQQSMAQAGGHFASHRRQVPRRMIPGIGPMRRQSGEGWGFFGLSPAARRPSAPSDRSECHQPRAVPHSRTAGIAERDAVGGSPGAVAAEMPIAGPGSPQESL